MMEMPEVKAPRAQIGKPEASSRQQSAVQQPVPAVPAIAEPNKAKPADRTYLAAPADVMRDTLAYQRDFFERSILFWDTLRQRANNMIAHERAGKPPLLDFDYETLADARRFERPVNYALLRITRIDDDCVEDCIDAAKPPIVIVDPRAGHGPGIGGFKRDSEVGMALHEGYPVYFVSFFPEPCLGQTLADVLHALRRFVDDVIKRHPGKPPVLYGNCQAGWAITLLSADCEGMVGTAVLNGSPLSYWAGESGANPMRIAGGLLGGVWSTHLLADLNDGRFDGAWLALNFENLKPEAVWDKYANLFMHVDTERERFLEFERWWNGFYFLSREEIVAIVENLFIGNRLEEGKMRICDGCVADLRRIRNPLVIFASYGDNITPPHQALGWIPVVYKDISDLKSAGQRIVYLTDPRAGHLGIFVSAKIARFEHRAILESLGEIATLAPGLYELKIDNPTGNPDCHKPEYSVRFEERRVEDLRFDAPRVAFEQVRHISEVNEQLYKTMVSPFVRMASNPWTAATLEWLHPMRTSRYLLSESFNPWMHGVAALARLIEQRRQPLPEDDANLRREREAIGLVSDAIEDGRKQRDSVEERVFQALYDIPSLARPAAPPAAEEHEHGR